MPLAAALKKLKSFSDVQTSITRYARALNLAFTNTLFRIFPREIRDRVYLFLSGGNGRITVCDGKLPHLARRPCNCTQTYHSFWMHSNLNHYLDPWYVGPMAYELAEVHYKMSAFYFDHHELYLINKFLTVDRFGLQMRPVDLIRNVEVVLDASATCSCLCEAVAHHGPASSNMTPNDAILFCLQRFLFLEGKQIRIKILILLHQAKYMGRRLYQRTMELFELIRPFLERCIERDYTITLGLIDFGGSEWEIEGSDWGEIQRTTQQVLGLEVRLS